MNLKNAYNQQLARKREISSSEKLLSYWLIIIYSWEAKIIPSASAFLNLLAESTNSKRIFTIHHEMNVEKR